MPVSSNRLPAAPETSASARFFASSSSVACTPPQATKSSLSTSARICSALFVFIARRDAKRSARLASSVSSITTRYVRMNPPRPVRNTCCDKNADKASQRP